MNPNERQMNDVSAIKEVKCADCGTMVPAWIEDESTRCDGQPYIWADCEDGPCGVVTGQDSIRAIHNETIHPEEMPTCEGCGGQKCHPTKSFNPEPENGLCGMELYECHQIEAEAQYLDFINGNGWKWEAPSSYETGNFVKCELSFGYQCRLSAIRSDMGQPTKATHTIKMQIIESRSGDSVDLMSLISSPWVDSYLGADTLFIANVWPTLDSFPDIEELVKAHYVPRAKEASEEATRLIRALAADQSDFLISRMMESRAHLSHVFPCGGCGEIATEDEYNYENDECVFCMGGDY